MTNDQSRSARSMLARYEYAGRRYLGARNNGVIRIRNIRYATAGRFCPPVPFSDTQPDEDAFHAAPACPQLPQKTDDLWGTPYRGAIYDEDCLRLSITAPDPIQSRQRLPVLVWIHGGSYVSGAGDLPIYDPTVLATEGPVIVVNVTYRIGVLGFPGSTTDRSGNLGLLDLRMALQWIQETIHIFGGDPDQVTLFGQSAGADAIAHLMITPDAPTLFRRVILQSAPFGIRGRRGKILKKITRAMGEFDSASPIEDVIAMQLAGYRAARTAGLRAGMPFSPEYGVTPLPAETDVQREWEDAARHFDVLIGWNADETTLFALQSPAVRALFRTPIIGRRIRKMVIGASTDAVYRRAGHAMAQLLRAGNPGVHEYELIWRPTTMFGATHSIELPLLFPNQEAWKDAAILDGLNLDVIRAAGAHLRHAWVEFAYYGRLNERILPIGDDGFINIRTGAGAGASAPRAN